MHDEDDFLRKLSETPADDTVRLVYADWLDERGDAESKTKAQFLRVTVRLMGTDSTSRLAETKEKELQQLAATLPTDWLAVVSRLKVEGCGQKSDRHLANRTASYADVETLFEFVCDKQWDEMTPTEDQDVRHCGQCKQNVHYCDTITVAREHAEKGHCVAVDLGIIRRQRPRPPACSGQVARPPKPSATRRGAALGGRSVARTRRTQAAAERGMNERMNEPEA